MNFTLKDVVLPLVTVLIGVFLAPLANAYLRESGIKKFLNKTVNIIIFLCFLSYFIFIIWSNCKKLSTPNMTATYIDVVTISSFVVFFNIIIFGVISFIASKISSKKSVNENEKLKKEIKIIEEQINAIKKFDLMLEKVSHTKDMQEKNTSYLEE